MPENRKYLQRRDDFKRRLLFASALIWTSSFWLLCGHAEAANGSNGNNEQTSASSQPLWSYQVKPGQVSTGNLFADSFGLGGGGGLSQRQGALTTGPLMTILPILLIAAGGILLLLPFLTMMFASPFGGPGSAGGLYGYNNGGQFGYPQAAAALRAAAAAGAAAKKRSLNHQPSFDQPRVWQELLDHVSTTIDELSKKYSPITTTTIHGMAGANNRFTSSTSKLFNSGQATATASASPTTSNDPSIQLAANGQQAASSTKPQT